MAVGPQRNTQDLQPIIKDSVLKHVKEYKYLGFTIDSNLDYQLHRQKLFGKVQKKFNYLVKIRKLINALNTLLIYKTKIMSLIDYADCIYEQGIIYANTRIQQLRNRALRIIFNQHLKKCIERMGILKKCIIRQICIVYITEENIYLYMHSDFKKSRQCR